MSKRNLGLIALAFVVCVLSGCNPQDRVAISPDGKTAVIANSGDLIFRDIQRHRPDDVLHFGRPKNETIVNESPSYSPNGKWVIAQPVYDSVLIDTASKKRISIPNFGPPYAWKPNSGEVAGFCGSTCAIYNLRSNSVVRTYDLPNTPQFVAWAGDGRDIVFGDQKLVRLLHRGKLESIATKGDVRWLGFDKASQRILWAELVRERQPSSEP